MIDISIIMIDLGNCDGYIHHNDKSTLGLLMESLEQLGLTIKTLRKQRGWSQLKLAEMSGLDRTTLGMLERNDYTDIGIRKVQRVLELLGKKLSLTNSGLPTLDDLLAAQVAPVDSAIAKEDAKRG